METCRNFHEEVKSDTRRIIKTLLAAVGAAATVNVIKVIAQARLLWKNGFVIFVLTLPH